jgi:hypothetical protein
MRPQPLEPVIAQELTQGQGCARSTAAARSTPQPAASRWAMRRRSPRRPKAYCRPGAGGSVGQRMS